MSSAEKQRKPESVETKKKLFSLRFETGHSDRFISVLVSGCRITGWKLFGEAKIKNSSVETMGKQFDLIDT